MEIEARILDVVNVEVDGKGVIASCFVDFIVILGVFFVIVVALGSVVTVFVLSRCVDFPLSVLMFRFGKTQMYGSKTHSKSKLICFMFVMFMYTMSYSYYS